MADNQKNIFPRKIDKYFSQMKNFIPLLICFSRSGGTLMNKILGSLQNTIVLSEVNPRKCFKPIAEQAAEWFDLIHYEEKQKINILPFCDQIKMLQERAYTKKKHLIIRDWTAVNFIDGLIHDQKPTFKLETINELEDCFNLKPLVLMRDPYSMWVSNRKQFGEILKLSPTKFFKAYKKYLIEIKDYPKIKLEDFTAFPEQYMKWICKYWDLDFSIESITGFYKFLKCTGDNTLARKNWRSNSIKPVYADVCKCHLDFWSKKKLVHLYKMTSYEPNL